MAAEHPSDNVVERFINATIVIVTLGFTVYLSDGAMWVW